jgi:ATP-dependent exoDNAse (exonuclease V) alpha subunit
MAIFQMQISSLARSAGRRATAAAAYRAGERIRDERTGELHNYRRRDVLHAEIFLPSQFEGASVAWARNRERLWNTAEHAEKRHNSRVAREFQVNLPPELDSAQQLALARTFAREIADRYKVAVDLAVHAPRPGGDPRNFHAHLLTTTREVTPAGLGAKTGLDMVPVERRRRELPDHRQEYVNVRERWATLTNSALREANIAARIDHRSLAAQGVELEPLPAIPLMHLKMEQRGVRSELAERLRAEYRARVQRRAEREVERPDIVASASEPRPVAARAPAQITDVEEIRRQAREAWLLLRSKEAAKAAGQFHDQPQTSERTARDPETAQSQPRAKDDLAL